VDGYRYSHTDLFSSNDVPCAFSRPSGLSPSRVGVVEAPSKVPITRSSNVFEQSRIHRVNEKGIAEVDS
jgi:hypothetical protein